MEKIIRRTMAKGEIGGREITVLFDTGAESSVIRKDVAQAIGRTVTLPEPVPMITADGRVAARLNEAALFFVKVEGVDIWVTAFVAESLEYDLVLGCIDMERWDIRPIPKNGSVTIPRPTARVRVI